MGHFWPTIKYEVSKNICIWTAAKNCASSRSIIHFYVFVMVPEVLKNEQSPKMGIFNLKWAILDPKKIQGYQQYFYLNGTKKCDSICSTIHSYVFMMRIVQK